MSKHGAANLRIKRKYLVWLKDAKGLSETTIDRAAAAISVYESFLGDRDFRAFHAERARAFKRHLRAMKNASTGAMLADATTHATLREIRTFFLWMADQPGYRSKIKHSEAAYFSGDRRTERSRHSSCWKPHPSPAQVAHVLRTMPTETVLDRRDRSLVAFLFLTGSREGAAITIRLRHVDLANACVHFDGRDVKTKFGKRFTTAFFPFGKEIEQTLRDWVAELRTDHLFGASDPLFPKTRVGLDTDRRFAPLGIARKPWANPSSAAKIFKSAFVNAGLPSFSPHRVRDTIAELARAYCRTPEHYKSWSQNLGHDDVLTTFTSYGSVAPGRQMELLARFRRRGPSGDPRDDDDIIEPF